MARLVITSDGFGEQVIELKLGANRLGRSPECEFPIEHPTVSAIHCEIMLVAGGLLVRDCASTNGTLIDGRPIQQAEIRTGQVLRLGCVELLVETTEVTIGIPKFDMPRPAPPVVLADGSLICPRHPQARATHQCTHCREVMCDQCLHRLRRRGGKVLKLCPLCSRRCLPIEREKPKKPSMLRLFGKTVKLPFLGPRRQKDEQ